MPVALQSPLVLEIIKTLHASNDVVFEAFGTLLVSNQWLAKAEERGKEIASKLADETWETKSTPKSKAAVLSSIQKLLAQHLDMETQLADVVWAEGRSALALTSYDAFTQRMEDLSAASEEQFSFLWTSRVVEKVRIYIQGLNQLEEGTLKTQLTLLLVSHITKDLVPGAVSRATARNLLPTSKRKYGPAMAKLQHSLEDMSDLDEIVKALDKVNQSAGIPEYPIESLLEKKDKHLQGMVHSMQKDSDSARLFLSLVIVLLGKYNDGVLYATGKFAPRLLKHLKPNLDAQQAVKLEQLKDAVKAAAVDQTMLDDIRAMAMLALPSKAL
jgi:hypothetical protein